jgi:hypothetical protein
MKKGILICVLLFGIFYVKSQSTSFAVEDNVNFVNDSSAIAYDNVIAPIVANNCLTCHSGTFPSADMDLGSYDYLVSAIKNNGLLQRINNVKDPMPTSGLMSKSKRLLIEKWAKNGFPKESNQTTNIADSSEYKFVPPSLQAINIENEGFEFLDKIQGHWVGKMFLLGQNIPWFAFDFRAINTSQVHGLFEGGSMGNLFNTFFVAEYKGVKTIMLRNGGILNGIYRTSYFVLTSVTNKEYIFEDAYGGKKIMWVKVSFSKDKMKMLTYTSKLGANKASRHMEFEGTNLNKNLAIKAAKKFKFPTKKVFKSFPDGMPVPTWGEAYPIVTSATYLMASGKDADYSTLGRQAQDPIQISDLKNIASLELNFKRNDLSKDKNISVYLSSEPLTNKEGKMKMEYGYITEETMNRVILFPQIDKTDDLFKFNYLHTGKSYITFLIDNDNNFIPSKGDFYSPSLELNLTENSALLLEVDNITKRI